MVVIIFDVDVDNDIVLLDEVGVPSIRLFLLFSPFRPTTPLLTIKRTLLIYK